MTLYKNRVNHESQSSTPIECPQEEQETRAVSKPFFSVVLCTYNRRDLVLSTLASLRRQTLPYEQFEVIVVDNGSTDGTIGAVFSYAQSGAFQHNGAVQDIWRVRCFSEQRNGLAYARNKGIHAAKGDVAVFLDDDTLADPAFLERLMESYRCTGADVIGGRVDLRFEAQRPHWLKDDLLETLGYFAPTMERGLLPESICFSNSNFSVKMEVLRRIGDFSPFLSKRLHAPASMAVHDLCQHLREQGYALWYEPAAVVTHRVSAARLQRPFFVGRAYWKGRAEVLMEYSAATAASQPGTSQPGKTDEATNEPKLLTLPHTLREVMRECLEIVRMLLFFRPLLFLAHKTLHEQLQAAMAQARNCGRLWQHLLLLEHMPATKQPAILFVRPTKNDAWLLVEHLQSQQKRCVISTGGRLPLLWLWRHRAYQGVPTSIIHIYRPGAFAVSGWRYQYLRFWLYVAQCMGIRLVITDAGGWWQNIRGPRFLSRRMFERQLLTHSDLVLSSTRQPEVLYPAPTLRRRVRCLPHPGFVGACQPLVSRQQAHVALGLPQSAGFVYLCLSSMHTEQELMLLCDAFLEAEKTSAQETTSLAPDEQEKLDKEARKNEQKEPGESLPNTPTIPDMPERRAQLLLAGAPCDKSMPTRLLQRAAQTSNLHIFLERREDKLPLYLGAAHAIVIPHLAQPSAGVLEIALQALSYERVVVAPDLPRFHGMLPQQAAVFYKPGCSSSLAQALLTARTCRYTLSETGLSSLDAKSGWEQYAQRLLEIYQRVLRH